MITKYLSPLVSCLSCREVKSSKSLFSHIFASHTEEGKVFQIKLGKSTKDKPSKLKTKAKEIRDSYNLNPNFCGCGKAKNFDGRNNKYCSSSCAATYNNRNRGLKTAEERKKIGKSVKLYMKANPKPPYTPIRQCNNCGKYYSKLIRLGSANCSDECSHTIRSRKARANPGLCTKRSKDEIELYELCKAYFRNVTANEKIADGWDADILIYDTKTAILWNGPWHYKEMNFGNHSLKQVQNRDLIKTSEFEKLGWTVLVFEDRYYTPQSAFGKLVPHVGNAPTLTAYEAAIPL